MHGAVGCNELLQTDVELGGIVHGMHGSAQLLREREQIRRMQWGGAIASRHKYQVAAGEGLHEQVGAGFASGVNEGVQREIKRQLNVKRHEEPRKLAERSSISARA